MKKRYFITAGGTAVVTAWLSQHFPHRTQEEIAIAQTKFEIVKTDQEWRKILTPEQYRVLRHEGTERPGSSPLVGEHRQGIFACAGCDLPLFISETKYESHTGWPSFYAPIDNAIETSQDGLRVEVHCRRCGGHLGHVFEDGPKPTGQRYCMNGVALKFMPNR